MSLGPAPRRTPTSTIPDVADVDHERRSHRVRRVAIGVLVVLVLLGLSGALGVRSRTVEETSSGGALRAELTYASVARPALAVPFRLVLVHPGGFTEPVEVRITSSWLDSFDENGVEPEPAESTTEGDEAVWTFDPPPGEVFTLSLDTRVEPGVQWKREGTTFVETGLDRVRLHHTMWILP